MKNFNLPKKQSGFTLTELIIVVVILGILSFMVYRAVGGSTDPANAGAMRSSAKTMANAIGYIHTNLGTGLNPTTSPLPASGLNMMDVLMVGDTAVAAAYKTQYTQINMRPLEGEFKVVTRPTGSTPGVYQLLTYPVSFVTCTTGKVCVQMTSVPTTTLQELSSKYGYTSFAPGTAVATGPLRYTAVDANGFHTVTLENVP